MSQSLRIDYALGVTTKAVMRAMHMTMINHHFSWLVPLKGPIKFTNSVRETSFDHACNLVLFCLALCSQTKTVAV